MRKKGPMTVILASPRLQRCNDDHRLLLFITRYENNGVKDEYKPRRKIKKEDKDELAVDIEVQRSVPHDECPVSLEKVRVMAGENADEVGYIGYDQTR